MEFVRDNPRRLDREALLYSPWSQINLQPHSWRVSQIVHRAQARQNKESKNDGIIQECWSAISEVAAPSGELVSVFLRCRPRVLGTGGSKPDGRVGTKAAPMI